MKATKTELIRLARLAQKDIASGRVSKNAQQAVEALSDYQNSAIELLDLTLEEATQEQSNKSLVDSFGFLFGQSLEALRFDIEFGYRTASELAESVRKRLVTVSKAKACDPFTLLFLVQCFGAAKLDLGEDLRGVVEHLLEEAGEASADDSNPAELADMFGFVADLVKQADDDPFVLHSLLAESSEGMPGEHRAVMATALLFSGEATAVEASVGWLLDPAPSVRQALASALQDAARKGNVTPTMLRRMIAMRNWLPGDSAPRLTLPLPQHAGREYRPLNGMMLKSASSRAPASMALARLVFSRIVAASESMCSAASCSSTALVCAMRGPGKE